MDKELTESEIKAVKTFGLWGVNLVALKRAGEIVTNPDEICPIINCKGCPH